MAFSYVLMMGLCTLLAVVSCQNRQLRSLSSSSHVENDPRKSIIIGGNFTIGGKSASYAHYDPINDRWSTSGDPVVLSDTGVHVRGAIWDILVNSTLPITHPALPVDADDSDDISIFGSDDNDDQSERSTKRRSLVLRGGPRRKLNNFASKRHSDQFDDTNSKDSSSHNRGHMGDEYSDSGVDDDAAALYDTLVLIGDYDIAKSTAQMEYCGIGGWDNIAFSKVS